MGKIAILFDIDGTLLSTGGAGGRAMLAALTKEFQKSITASDISLAGRCDRGIFSDILKAVELEVSEDNFSKLAESYFTCLVNEIAANDSVLLPGVRELLDYLHAHEKVSLGLLTGNFKRGADIKLKHFGIANYFNYGGFGDNFACRNELAKDTYNIVKKTTGISNPEHIWIIGDTPADVACAKAIGAKCVAVATGAFQKHELEQLGAEHVLENLTSASAWHEAIL